MTGNVQGIIIVTLFAALFGQGMFAAVSDEIGGLADRTGSLIAMQRH